MTSPHPKDPISSTSKASHGDRDSKKSSRKRNYSSESESRRRRSPVDMLNELPDETCLWTERHLDQLRIHPYFRGHDHPSPMMTESILLILGAESYSIYVHQKSQNENVKIMKDCLAEALSSFHFDHESIHEVSLIDVYRTKTSLQQWWKNFLCITKENDFLKEICIRVATQGQLFADQLEYMVLRRERGEILLEGMYQQLFMLFVMMFNLPVFGSTNIESKSYQIGNNIVSSVPDMLIMDTKLLMSPVISVVEVKRDVCREEPSTSRHTQRHKIQRNLDVVDLSHISMEHIGQVGGDLLTHLPLSIFGSKGVLGMIVHATMISFTSLIPEENYLSCLRNGDVLDKKCTLLVSKECNILSQTGRQKLLEPFIELVFLYSLSKEKKMNRFL